jgi:hypothetical protein
MRKTLFPPPARLGVYLMPTFIVNYLSVYGIITMGKPGLGICSGNHGYRESDRNKLRKIANPAGWPTDEIADFWNLYD